MRVNEFSFQYLSDQFIICRGYLRKILSEFISFPPDKIKFVYSEYGKPEIESQKEIKIQFNLSHSEEYFIIAISDLYPIGIDIEYCKPDLEIFEIAKEVFTQNEISKLYAVHEHQRVLEFFKIWTIKEAYIKAIGRGFSFDSKMIEFDENLHNFKSNIHEFNNEAKNLSFSQCFLHSDYSVAFATQLDKPHIILHTSEPLEF